MKHLLFFILLLVYINNNTAFCQTKDVKLSLLNMFLAKRDYEKAVLEMLVYNKNPLQDTTYKKKYYLNLIREIKSPKMKKKVIRYIRGEAPKEKKYAKRNAVIEYVYEDTLSSYIDFNNMISYPMFLKIVKYCLFDKNLDELLPLKEIPFYSPTKKY